MTSSWTTLRFEIKSMKDVIYCVAKQWYPCKLGAQLNHFGGGISFGYLGTPFWWRISFGYLGKLEKSNGPNNSTSHFREVTIFFHLKIFCMKI
jgi:hypothetical protein